MDAVKPAPVPDVIVSWRAPLKFGNAEASMVIAREERERDWKLKDNQAHLWGGEETGDFLL